jgi:NAD-dependent dihydropyrimidine dehydrogenase PreA subunit
VDVWCAATGGRFNIDSIISILKTSRIGQLVDHRRLILPELSATGINIFDLRKRSGWSAVFGPVRAEDIPEYLATRRRPEAMIRVSFSIKERLEMAIGMWGSLSLRYTLFPCLVFGWTTAPWFILALAVFSVGVSLGCFILPGKTFVQKAGVLGLLAIAGLVGVGVSPWHPGVAFVVKWAVLSAFASFLVGTAFPSYSPLWPCGYSKLFYGACDLHLAIIEEKCIGCKLCDLVCPVECFALTPNRKMIFADPSVCIGCGACLIQCPTDAIINEVADDHRLQTAHG